METIKSLSFWAIMTLAVMSVSIVFAQVAKIELGETFETIFWVIFGITMLAIGRAVVLELAHRLRRPDEEI